MSNELLASETTPLRRPESAYSSEDVSLTADKSLNNNKQLEKTETIVKLPQTAPPNNIQLTTENNLQQLTNNNNSINNNQHHNNNITIATTTDNVMDTNKRVLYRVAIDVLILLTVGFPILLFYLFGEAYKRGFFCDDESLKHPFKDSTVKNWMLYIIGIGLPVGTIFIVELIKSQLAARQANGNNSPKRRYIFMDYEIPDWLVECYKKAGAFAFGAAVCQLATDIAKYSIGRLRPHFFAVCQPIILDGTTCESPTNVGKYITEFRCEGINSTPTMLKEVRLSFPSGHSSFTFYTMVYVALYLQARMTWRGSKLLRHFLQFMFIMIAWYTALSRISDYKHHWSDVLAGSTLGALSAIIVANCVSDLFENRTKKSISMLPLTTQDMHSTHTYSSNGH